MVWFQCEDCGENLKKPKLANHFRGCTSRKLSCIDCGVTFTQQSVQGHTQCISEAEKYGPKNVGLIKKETTKASGKVEDCHDLNVSLGLSTRPPWSCSLCNVKATSQETLLLHSQGKKHKSKVRSMSSNVSNGDTMAVVSTAKEGKFSVHLNGLGEGIPMVSKCENGSREDFAQVDNRGRDQTGVLHSDKPNPNPTLANGSKQEQTVAKEKKRKFSKDMGIPSSYDTTEVNTAVKEGEACYKLAGERVRGSVKPLEAGCVKHNEPSRRKHKEDTLGDDVDKAWSSLVKWKKVIKRSLKDAPDGSLKIRHLRRSILPSVMELVKKSGLKLNKESFSKELKRQIQLHGKFIVDGKMVRLAL